MAWGPDGNLYVSQASGEIIELVIGTDGLPIGSMLVGNVSGTLLGLTFVGQDLFASYTGAVAKLTLVDGKATMAQKILTGLPFGRHQNDELIYGKDGFLYMGIGSTGDRTNGNDSRSATIVRFKPDGAGFEIFAKGLRNPYGVGFDKDGNLFATDNGPDNPVGPDEFNYIVKGGDYGFPNYYGTPPPNSGTIGPVANLQLHSSSDGFTFYYGNRFPQEYLGNAFIAQWGASSADPNIGERIVRVPLQRTNGSFVGQEIVFATGFDHPIDVIDDHVGGLLVEDYGSGTIYQITYNSSASGTQSSTAPSSAGGSNAALDNFTLIFSLLILAFGVTVVLAWRKLRHQKQVLGGQ
jgi:glucose/arabinose dehydrogenase